MNIFKNNNGSYEISEVVNGYRVHQVYIGYTKIKAMKEFKKLTWLY